MIWPTNSTNQEERDDQTVFMSQEPWLEDGSSQVKVQPPVTAIPAQPMSRGKKLVLGGVVATSLLVIVLLAWAVLSRRSPLVLEPSPTPQATKQPISLDSFNVRFQQVRADLRAADPAKSELPFPPVDTEIQLQYGDKKR